MRWLSGNPKFHRVQLESNLNDIMGYIGHTWTTIFSWPGWLGMAKETSLWDIQQYQPQDQQCVWTGRTQYKHIHACKRDYQGARSPNTSACSHRWKTCVMRISTLSWASFMTVACSPLWQSSAPEAVWRICWKTMMWSWTGCSSHLCCWIWLRSARTEGQNYFFNETPQYKVLDFMRVPVSGDEVPSPSRRVSQPFEVP